MRVLLRPNVSQNPIQSYAFLYNPGNNNSETRGSASHYISLITLHKKAIYTFMSTPEPAPTAVEILHVKKTVGAASDTLTSLSRELNCFGLMDLPWSRVQFKIS